MNEHITITLERILGKVNELNLQLSLLKQENKILRSELKKQKETIELQKNTIRELEDKNKIVKLAQAVHMSKEDKRKVKLKINEYIREIDRCIAVLNE